jgi:hypothetical protein
MTLLSDPARHRLVLAVTATDAPFTSRPESMPKNVARTTLLSNASTVSDDDDVLTRSVPIAARAELGDMARSSKRCCKPTAWRSIVSLRHAGAPVVLDNNELQIGRKASIFARHSSGAPCCSRTVRHPDAVSDHASPRRRQGRDGLQATKVTGLSEAVLVSLIPSVLSVSVSPSAGREVQVASAVLRDLRLMQASPGPAAERATRRYRRMFMPPAPLRSAPRASPKHPIGRALTFS